jgi:hypothetical protein
VRLNFPPFRFRVFWTMIGLKMEEEK